MPLRVVKPFYRVDRLQDRYRVSYFTSKNRQLLRRGFVDLPLNDRVGFEEEVKGYVDRFCGPDREQGK